VSLPGTAEQQSVQEHPELGRIAKVFWKLEPLSTPLQARSRELWYPGNHLSIDECIQGFGGRATEIVNIPSKPVTEGFKIWLAADPTGHALGWLWHGKGLGPQGLYQRLISSSRGPELSKTEAVVPTWCTQMHLERNQHNIALDGGNIALVRLLVR
jgi:hypothetical protein